MKSCISASNSNSEDFSETLVVTRTFLPSPGGIEDYAYSLCMRNPQHTSVLCPDLFDAEEFDGKQSFSVYRWPAPPMPQVKALAGLLKQIVYLFWEFVSVQRLYKQYQYSQVQWCHGYDFPALLLLSYLLPCQFVMHLHGNDLLCPLRNPVLRRLFALTLNRMDRIVCNSSFTKKFLLEHFSSGVPIHVVNPVIRPAKFGATPTTEDISEIRLAHGIADSSLVLLSVGRLVPRKGFDTVIKLLPQLLETGLDVHYVVCGKGKQMAELRALANSLNLDDRVHFAGYVPDDQLASYYMACDIFALPTFFNASAKSIEGFGIVYTEAGYFGKPVIACDVGGVPDAVKHEENGLMVPPDRPDEILQSILRLCNDAELRARLGKRGRELAIANIPNYSSTPQEAA